ncbi:MAG TPA: hypothetical protein VFJ85_07830 [Acidimicrobiales bacterium]|nr:hypothetical protein [Acidimicrobiales bacterium]
MDEGERLQRQARALGQPTRHALFRLIDQAPEPPGVRELATTLGLHHSAVRQHLALLIGAGLVLEERDPVVARGRPRSIYRRAPGVLGVWGSENHFERLAALLLDAVRTRDEPRLVGRDAGRAITGSPAGQSASAGRAAFDVLTDLVAAHGFAPLQAGSPAAPELVLTRCPYASLAAVAPDVVCELHRGLAEGIADNLPCDQPVEVVALVRRDPVVAGCRLLLRERASAG